MQVCVYNRELTQAPTSFTKIQNIAAICNTSLGVFNSAVPGFGITCGVNLLSTSPYKVQTVSILK